jgi:O-antigen/teichoic acid export membrane protein
MINELMRGAVGIARKNTSVVLLTTVLSNLARLLSTVVLTRILEPSAYGVVGILSTIGFALALVTDVGIYSFVVRHSRHGDPTFLDQIWTLRLIRCVALAVLVIVLAPILSIVFAKTITLPLIAFSLTFVFEGLSSMSFATAIRERQIVRLSVMDLLPQIASVPVAFVFGLWLRSYWALVIAMLASGFLGLILSYALFPQARRRWNYNSEISLELWRFGRNMSASSVVFLIITQTDKVILAHWMPIATFGLYSIASNLAAAVKIFNNKYTKRILFPSFAMIKDENTVVRSRVFYATGHQIRMIYMFGSGILLACAPLIIRVLYDPRYADAAMFLGILAFGNIASLHVSAANEMLVALGRTKNILSLNIARLAFLIVGGISGIYFFGAPGLVAAVSGMEIAALVYSWTALSRAEVLDLRRELPLWATSAVGFGVGLAVNCIGMRLVPL